MSGDLSISGDKFVLPECLHDYYKIQALFAPFRSKSLDPTYWDYKMKFWTELIDSWCKHNKYPFVEISTLMTSFAVSNAVPVCLEEVVSYLNRVGILVNKDNIKTSDETWETWAVNVLVLNPLKWAFNTVKNTIIKPNETKEIYVHLPTVKYLSEELLKKFSSERKIYSFDDLVKLSYGNSETLTVVLHWMQRQGWAAIIQKNGQIYVKLGSGTRKLNITETDIGIYSLEQQQKLLEDNIRKLTSERNLLLEETKSHLAAKNKNLALVSFRRKKELEKTIEKRSLTLENIQALLFKIEQAKLDAQVVSCYKEGITALNKIYKKNGLSVESVTDTLHELKELLNKGNELENAMEKAMDPLTDESIEEELNELLLEDAPKVPENELSIESPQKKKKEKSDLNLQMEALSL